MLNKILSTCEYVANNSKHVKINNKKIDKTIEKLKDIKIEHWLQCNPYNLLELDIKELVNFLIIYGSIDYSFWGEPKWTIKTEKGSEDGAFALIKSLLDLKKYKGHLNFEKITYEEFKKYLTGNIEIPLIEERYKTVLEVSKIINKKMNGNFYKYIKDITKDEELFTLIINLFPSFKDKRTYKGKTIYFYKLAQLVTSDILHIREYKEKIKVDYTNLLGCADYKIPQALRALEILEYDEKLSQLVDNKIELKENSIYETEIRANMIIAISRLKEKLNGVCSIDINDMIWVISHDKSLNIKPYHRTRTTSY